MISNFLLQKAMPIFLALLGISCIDTPQNFVRRVMFQIMDTIVVYFQALLQF